MEERLHVSAGFDKTGVPDLVHGKNQWGFVSLLLYVKSAVSAKGKQ